MARKSFIVEDRRPSVNAVTGQPAAADTRQLLGERIRLFRKKAGLRQPELADRLGISKTAVSSWETGHSRPDIDHLPRLCRILQVSPSLLLGLEQEVTSAELQHLQVYRQLHPLDRRTVDHLAEDLLYAQHHRQKERPELIRAWRTLLPLAAGVGDPSEWADESEEIYLRLNARTRHATYVFPVNGASMEPDYPSGCLVAVESSNVLPAPGTVGAFQLENALYIKEYRPDGLYSLNPDFEPILFRDHEEILLIGRVNGIIQPEDLATEEEIALYMA